MKVAYLKQYLILVTILQLIDLRMMFVSAEVTF